MILPSLSLPITDFTSVFPIVGEYMTDWKICTACSRVFFKKDIPKSSLKHRKFRHFTKCVECREVSMRSDYSYKRDPKCQIYWIPRSVPYFSL